MHTTGQPMPTTVAGAVVPPPRIPALDVLRGFALCGILLVNIGPVTHFQDAVPHGPPTLADPSGWLQLLVQQRFFPIFSVLFGIGFSLFLASAARRADQPRLLLARRLLVLLPVGVLHQVWHPGEALLLYAVVGLLVLLPSSWLPRRAVAAASVVGLVLPLLTVGGGLLLIPGCFLIGSALVRYGIVARTGESGRAPAVLLAAFAAVSVPAVLRQLDDVAGSGFTTASAVAGLGLAGTYVCGVLLLLRSPLRRPLEVAFVPLGRMALTCYLTATPVMVAAGRLLDLPRSDSWTVLLLLAVAVLVTQWAASTWWLRHFRQGPLEWLWRCATWARWQPLRSPRTHRARLDPA